MTRIAIIGAGLSGLVAGQILHPHAEVTIFEKARGVGGRMATRYAGPYEFDHGTQFFTAKTDAFKAWLKPLLKEGIVQRWDARFVEIKDRQIQHNQRWHGDHPHYVGAPRMNAMAKTIAKPLNVQCRTTVTAMRHKQNQWTLLDQKDQQLGCFDWVMITAPLPQTQQLLPSTICNDILPTVTMDGCMALMLGFEDDLALAFDAALIRQEALSWLSVNSSKPKRGTGYALVAHSTNQWANAHLNDDPDTIRAYLCHRLSHIIDRDVHQASYQDLQIWRYANVGKQEGPTHTIDCQHRISLCGDWWIQGRVEAAFTSGFQAAQALLTHI